MVERTVVHNEVARQETAAAAIGRCPVSMSDRMMVGFADIGRPA